MYQLNTFKFTFLNDIKDEGMKEIEKGYPKSRERLIKRSDWCIDDTIFLSGIVVAGIITIICFML